MASRGALGGLAVTTAQLVQVFDAVGFDLVLIETVGAGQAEVDITRLAHTTIVVEAPGFGDDIQAIKAGIMEIADILVINKADLPGVENTERVLRSNLEMGYARFTDSKSGHREEFGNSGEGETKKAWTPPILRTIATEDDGIGAVWENINQHYDYLKQNGKLAGLERDRLVKELNDLIRTRLINQWRDKAGTLKIETAIQQVIDKNWSPEQAVDWLINSN
jgi:LAO/AO transport system kinase